MHDVESGRTLAKTNSGTEEKHTPCTELTAHVLCMWLWYLWYSEEWKTEVEKLQRDRHTLHSLVTIKFVMNVQRKRANVIKASRHLSLGDKVAPQDDLWQLPVAFLRCDKWCEKTQRGRNCKRKEQVWGDPVKGKPWAFWSAWSASSSSSGTSSPTLSTSSGTGHGKRPGNLT